MPLLNKIAFATHKGGVGKTTTALNISHSLSLRGFKVLAVDLDPQAHLSRSFGVDRGYEQPCIADLFSRRSRLEVSHLIESAVRPGLDLLPATVRLAAAAENALHLVRRESLLREGLAEVEREYDFVLIDTAPGLGTLMANAIEAADRIIIPVDSGARAIDGLSDFIAFVRELRGSTFKRWRILRTLVNKAALKTQREHQARMEPYAKKLLSTIIHRSEATNQAHYSIQSVFEFQPNSQTAREYAQLSSELLDYVFGESSSSVIGFQKQAVNQ